MKKKEMSEEWHQIQIFKFARANQIKYPELQLLNGSLNGVKLSIGQATKAKRQGMRKGYPDIFLPVSSGCWHGLFIELKKESGGRTSKEQKIWLEKLLCNGYYSVVCCGWKNAIETIKIYLGI